MHSDHNSSFPEEGNNTVIWSLELRTRNIALGSVGILLNTLTLAAISCHSHMSLSLRVTLTNLASSDLGAMVVAVISTVFISSGYFDRNFCKISLSCFFLCVGGTTLTTLLIAGERATALFYPHHYRRYCTSKRKILLVIVCMWAFNALGLILSLPVEYDPTLKCIPMVCSSDVWLLLQGLVLVVVSVTVGAMYLAIACRLKLRMANIIHASDQASDHASDRASDHASDHVSDQASDHASDQASDHASDQVSVIDRTRSRTNSNVTLVGDTCATDHRLPMSISPSSVGSLTIPLTGIKRVSDPMRSRANSLPCMVDPRGMILTSNIKADLSDHDRFLTVSSPLVADIISTPMLTEESQTFFQNNSSLLISLNNKLPSTLNCGQKSSSKERKFSNVNIPKYAIDDAFRISFPSTSSFSFLPAKRQSLPENTQNSHVANEEILRKSPGNSQAASLSNDFSAGTKFQAEFAPSSCVLPILDKGKVVYGERSLPSKLSAVPTAANHLAPVSPSWQVRATLSTALLAGWFCLAYLPLGCYYIWIITTNQDRMVEVNSTRNVVLSLFPFINSLTNPFIFFWRLKGGFRRFLNRSASSRH